jgi:DNA-binding transcriptional LysR family regulator
LARTFLEVVAAGNFSSAAARLYVTQSTVSARIAVLEDQLGCRLFVRNKGGTTLTAQGRWFQSHATTLVRTVERVRQEIGIPEGFGASVTIGGRLGLWECLLLAALPRLREAAAHIAVRSEMGFEDSLMQGLVEGRIDIGVMYTPQHRPGLVVERLYDETLIYVGTDRGSDEPAGEGYVYVDWGPEFHDQHRETFPHFTGAGLSANVGWLGLQHILSHGGSGYFPARLVGEAIAAGRLHRRMEAPEFALPAYLVYGADAAAESVGLIARLIKQTSAQMLRSDQSALPGR